MTTTPPSPHCPSCFATDSRPGPDRPCPRCGWRPGTDNAPPALSIGTELHGSYRIGRVLGAGGFAITYLAWEQNLAQPVAIKEYLPTEWAGRAGDGLDVVVRDEAAREQFDWGLDRFLAEARAVFRFRDEPTVVNVYAFFEDNATAYLVMEYIDGVTLKQYLAEHGGRLSYRDALALLTPVMDALETCHRANLLHRDIAPDNICLTRDGRTKLIDFGAARQAVRDKTRLTSVYKRRYAPLEQQFDDGKQGPWTDVFALAATFYRVLAGRPPPEVAARIHHQPIEPPSALGSDIPAGAERALMKALELSIERRTQDIATLRRGLAVVPADGVAGGGRRRLRSLRLAVLGIIGLVLGGVLASGLYDALEASRRSLQTEDPPEGAAARPDPAPDRLPDHPCAGAECDTARGGNDPDPDILVGEPGASDTCAEGDCDTDAAAFATRPQQDGPRVRWGQPAITDNQGDAEGRFRKLDAEGRDLAEDATDWSCVHDRDTGLVWEVKTTDGGLRDSAQTFSWYNPDPRTNGGSPGMQAGGSCMVARCDTAGYVAAVNATRLCGGADWRMPTLAELRSLVAYGRYNPAIDTDWLGPTASSRYWTASAHAAFPSLAWGLSFYSGYDYWDGREDDARVRLVRDLP